MSTPTTTRHKRADSHQPPVGQSKHRPLFSSGFARLPGHSRTPDMACVSEKQRARAQWQSETRNTPTPSALDDDALLGCPRFLLPLQLHDPLSLCIPRQRHTHEHTFKLRHDHSAQACRLAPATSGPIKTQAAFFFGKRFVFCCISSESVLRSS